MLCAEELQSGHRYQGSVAIEVSTFGLGFQLPAGWTGINPRGTDWFHVGKDNEVGRVFIHATHSSQAQLRATMSQVFPVADAVLLTPRGPVAQEGRVLTGSYDASDGAQQFRAHVRVVSHPSGVSVAFVAVAPEGRLATYQRLARKIEQSLRFNVKPQQSGSPGRGGWAAALANKRVVKFAHGSGYSEKTEFRMCANGTFSRAFNATSGSIQGSGVMQSGHSGRWSVQGNVLTLRFNDGDVVRVTLEDRGGQLWIDGERWLREDYVCR